MERNKWYRVIDPLNPLFGCDVRGDLLVVEGTPTGRLEVDAMRRLDITVGDRPFQLVAKPGEYLGVAVDIDHLDDSPVQDETVEMSTARPFGRCIDEAEMTRRDGLTLRIARYESAVQIAVEDADDGLLATRTLGDPDRKVENHIINLWVEGNDADDIVTALKLSGRD